jgi:hypothetical protein
MRADDKDWGKRRKSQDVRLGVKRLGMEATKRPNEQERAL